MSTPMEAVVNDVVLARSADTVRIEGNVYFGIKNHVAFWNGVQVRPVARSSR